MEVVAPEQNAVIAERPLYHFVMVTTNYILVFHYSLTHENPQVHIYSPRRENYSSGNGNYGLQVWKHS